MTADLAWNQLTRHADKPLQLRTYTTTDPATGQQVRAIRAAFSKYTAYDNLEFCEDLLSFADLAQLPVLSFVETDTAMRIRFALEPVDRIEVNKPIPMVEAWNSEVGCRSVGLCAGTWRLVCLNGMTSWNRGNVWSWRHTGHRDRIRRGVPQAVTEIKVKARGLVDQYEQALDIAIDDAHRWLEETLGGRDGMLTGEQVAASQEALRDPTTTPGGLLASVVDAVSLAAQREIDLYRQQQMESAALHVQRVGVDRAWAGTTDAQGRRPLQVRPAPVA